MLSVRFFYDCADYEFINLNSTTKSTARSFHSSENVLILDEMLLRCASRRPICSTGYKNVLAETYLIRMVFFSSCLFYLYAIPWLQLTATSGLIKIRRMYHYCRVIMTCYRLPWSINCMTHLIYQPLNRATYIGPIVSRTSCFSSYIIIEFHALWIWLNYSDISARSFVQKYFE